MKTILIIVLSACLLTTVQAQSSPSGGGGDYSHSCITGNLAAVVGVVNAGPVYACADGPTIASSNTAVLDWVGQASGPGIPAGIALTHTWTIIGGSTSGGCTVVLAQGQVSGTVAQSSAANMVITMTSNQCRLVVSLIIAYPAPVNQVFAANFAINIRVQSQASNLFLCEALGTVANTVDPDASICGPIDFGPTVNVAENITINENITVGNETTSQGFNGSLYVLMMVFVLALAHLGEMRRDNNYRIIAGFITIIAASVIVWEMDRLGFNNVLHGYGLGVAILWFGIHFWIATVLMIPKTWSLRQNE